MTGDCRVEALFTPVVTFLASTRAEAGGQLSPPSMRLEQGQRGEFTLTVEPGFQLESLSGCGGTLVDSRYLTAPMQQDCTVTAGFISNAENAIAQEDHRLASAGELIAFARATLASSEAQRQALVAELYRETESISWFPTQDSITFESYLPETTWALLPSNVKGNGDPAVRGLVMVSQLAEQRMAAMAANLFSVSRNDQSDQLLKRLIGWLTNGADQSGGLSVVTVQVPGRADSPYFPHNEGIRNWLRAFYPDAHRINEANLCDYDALSACIDAHQPDLIILSDIDRAGRGHEAIAAGLDKARLQGIPLLLSNFRRQASPMLTPLYQRMGLAAVGNYYGKLKASQLSVDTIKAADAKLTQVDQLLAALDRGDFDTEWLANCGGNFLHVCNDATFVAAFKGAANWLRQVAVTLDRQGRNPFTLNDGRLIKATLLLADKYRVAIDYPIQSTEPEAWQQAMFADWLVSYARPNNLPQPDLGEFVQESGQLSKGAEAHYAYPDTGSERRTVSVPFRNQWTTTGWYALPGQTVTLTRHDTADVVVQVKLNYHRPNTNRAFKSKVYRGPLELATQRLSIAPGQTLSFSSPYGGPIYLHLEKNGATGALETEITASGIAHHPAILDFSDAQEIAAFNRRLTDTELPHVDLRSSNAEQHLRRDRFLGAVGGAIADVNALLDYVINDHINPVYRLAGFKLHGQTLQQSLPAEVQSACVGLLGEDCLDTTLNTRTLIQHANYDQNAQCASGCSGNPWDASWVINPLGWGDNHELGHNLQVGRLNVHYVPADKADHWPDYRNRAGENSNNIFPYYVLWHSHYIRRGNTGPISDGHSNQKALFYAVQSDAAGLTDSEGRRVMLDHNCAVVGRGDRYEAPWHSGVYAVNNGYRMTFYLQMALRADGLTLADGTVLSNGFNLFTLLYQYHRVFGRYAGNAESWLANRQRLGFGLFPFEGETLYGGRTVNGMPGNDFMLVALSHLTGLDWRSHFDLLGLRYSSLAAAQAVANAKSGALPMGMYVLETDLPPANMSDGLTFLPLSLNDASTRWPRDNSSPLDCPQP